MVNNMMPTAISPHPQTTDLASRLQQLKTMLDAGLISHEEFDAKKAEIPSQL